MKAVKITIENGIPMIACSQSRNSIASALKSMDIGDSFILEAAHSSAVRAAARRNNLVVVQRELDSKNNRVWLISKNRTKFLKATNLCGKIHPR